MNFELTKEQQMIQKSASDFAKSVLEPIAYEDDRNARYPEEVISKIAAQDFMGMTIPKEYGGVGADFLSVALLTEAFGKWNAAAASITASHLIQAQTIAKYGSEAQKKAYLPKIANGEVLCGYAVAEPGASLASGADKVVAVKKDGGYQLTGKKTSVANGGVATLYVVIAQTNEEAGAKGISVFLVDGANVTVGAKIDKLGLRAFPTTELIFDGSKAELLGSEEQGPAILQDIQARLDIVNGAMASGIADMILEASINHCKTRVQFGAPIGRVQAVQEMLAEIARNAKIIRDMTYRAADMADSSRDYLLEAAYLKFYAMKAAEDAGMNGVQIHGGTGYSREDKIERYFRDIRGAFVLETVSEFPQKIIANALLK